MSTLSTTRAHATLCLCAWIEQPCLCICTCLPPELGWGVCQHKYWISVNALPAPEELPHWCMGRSSNPGTQTASVSTHNSSGTASKPLERRSDIISVVISSLDLLKASHLIQSQISDLLRFQPFHSHKFSLISQPKRATPLSWRLSKGMTFISRLYKDPH